MKIINFMIGDLILANGSPIQVSAIHQKKIGYHRRDDRLDWIRFDRITYIPITPEFLLKNEFTKEGKMWSYKDGCVSVILILSDDDYWDLHIRNGDIARDIRGRFLRVHQLQHEFHEADIKKDFVL